MAHMYHLFPFVSGLPGICAFSLCTGFPDVLSGPLLSDLFLHLLAHTPEITVFLLMAAYVLSLHQMLRNHLQITARFSECSRFSRIRIPGQFKHPLCSGYPDKEQSAFFFLLFETPAPQRDQPLIHPDHKYNVKLQSLGSVKRHQLYSVRRITPSARRQHIFSVGCFLPGVCLHAIESRTVHKFPYPFCKILLFRVLGLPCFISPGFRRTAAGAGPAHLFQEIHHCVFISGISFRHGMKRFSQTEICKKFLCRRRFGSAGKVLRKFLHSPEKFLRSALFPPAFFCFPAVLSLIPAVSAHNLHSLLLGTFSAISGVCKHIHRAPNICRIYRETQYFQKPFQHRYILQCSLHGKLEWNPLTFKHLRKNLCLPLQPVEHGYSAVGLTVLMQRPYPVRQIFRFLKRIVMILYHNPACLLPASTDLFPELHEPVCRLQDRHVRPVIHRKTQFSRRKPMFQPKKHILTGSPPAVYHLIRVAHGEQFCAGESMILRRILAARLLPPAFPRHLRSSEATERRQELKLERVAVLHLIHNDPCRTPAFSAFRRSFPVLLFRCPVRKQLRCHPQQICE